MDDTRRFAPATDRNREPILDVLRRVLPTEGTVLEVASGTGQHAVYVAAHLPRLVWQPSDADPAQRESIEAWITASGVTNVLPPLALDAREAVWPIERADAVVSINMIHIAPWSACEGLLCGTARVLRPGGVLYLYGPFRRTGVPTAPSNEAFDASLRGRDATWGVRDLEAVVALASRHGLTHTETVEMPAENLSVVFRREPRPGSSAETGTLRADRRTPGA